jgi:hypothetical protein
MMLAEESELIHRSIAKPATTNEKSKPGRAVAVQRSRVLVTDIAHLEA